jgi:hypothetical protein
MVHRLDNTIVVLASILTEHKHVLLLRGISFSNTAKDTAGLRTDFAHKVFVLVNFLNFFATEKCC